MGIILAVSDNASAPAATWTQALLGDDATGSINEISATTVSITAAGSVDPDNGTVAYQSVGSGNIQLICQVPAEYTGTTENFTFFGLQLREALTGTPVALQLASAYNALGSRVKNRVVTDGAASAYATGVTSYARPKYLAVTYDATAHEAKFWESTTGTADEYEQIGATLSITLSFPVYACLYGNSNDNTFTSTAALTNCTLGSSITISQLAATTRNLRGHLTWETGGINANGTIVGGLYTDGMYLQSLYPQYSARTITNITSSATDPVATYTGTQVVAGDGLTLGATGGYTAMRGRLIRVLASPAPTSTTFHVAQDGDDNGYNPTKTIEGNTRPDTTAYGAWGGNCTAQGWQKINTGSGNPTIPTDADIRVVTGITPPTNAISAANAVTPLVGSNFLSTEIHYYKPYEVIPNNTYNSPRFSASLGSGQGFAYNEEEWFSFSIFLPSNYDHETTNDGVLSRNQLMVLRATPSTGTNNPVEIHMIGWPTGTDDHYIMDYCQGTATANVRDVDLGSVVGDIDLWTTFVIRVINHETNGTLQIWKSTGADLGGGDRAMALVFDRTGAGVGYLPASAAYEWWFRQYKFAWHTSNNTINSTVVWIGWDEIRYGGVNEGTGFSDVHPFQRAQP